MQKLKRIVYTPLPREGAVTKTLINYLAPNFCMPAPSAASEENDALLKRLGQELAVAGYSRCTLKMYSLYAKAFLSFAKKPADDISREDIMAYLAHIKQDRNASNATLALIRASLKFLFQNLLHKKIVDDIKVPKKAKNLPTVLSQQEVKSLIMATKAGRSRLAAELLYSSGIRVSELVNMHTANVNLKEMTAVVKGGKGNKDRLVILSKVWCRAAKKHLKKKKVPSEFFFSKKNGKPLSADTIQRVIRNAAKKAGLQKHVTPHTLRHSFATHLLEAGESIRKIQELLGHSNLNTTQIYTRVSADELKKVSSPLDRL